MAATTKTLSTPQSSSGTGAQGWLRLPSKSELPGPSSTETARSTTRTASEVPGIQSRAGSTFISTRARTGTAAPTTTTITTTAAAVNNTGSTNSSSVGAVAAGLEQPVSKVSTRTLVIVCASLGGAVVVTISLAVCFLWWRCRTKKRHRGRESGQVEPGLLDVGRRPLRAASTSTTAPGFRGGSLAKSNPSEAAQGDWYTKDEGARRRLEPEADSRSWEYRASFVPSTPAVEPAEACVVDDSDSNVTRFTPGLGGRRAVARPLQASQAVMQPTQAAATITLAGTCGDMPNTIATSRGWSRPTMSSEHEGLGIYMPGSALFDRDATVSSPSRDTAPVTRPPVVRSPSSVYSPRPVHAPVRAEFIRAEAERDLHGRVRGDASTVRTAGTARTGFSSILRLYTDDGESERSGWG